MSDRPDWLPSLIEFDEYSGNWQQYIDAVYGVFNADFIVRRAYYDGKKILLIGKDAELAHGKERRFWHCVAEGKIEEERTPDLRRCERIPWMRPVLEHASDATVDVWVEAQSGKGIRPHLWFDEEFLVVLERLWKGDFRPITTLHTLRRHQIDKYRRRRDQWQKKNAAPKDGV